ncbi:hypothetical protein BLA29_001296 [Euroglyphus maynei]|uniref:Uncharacterized protein n=1 Tax=Euroglyphus maynei TaxID=6958 RepID=A0A1Y3ALL8_EURMA|nr:hypothetical protein BLA29_001296 [Euroglyphus maynei]
MSLDSILRIVNYPLIKMLLLKNDNIGYIDKMKKSELRRLLQLKNVDEQQPYQRFNNGQFLMQSFIFLFWLIRGFAVLFVHDGSISATILGSIFNFLKIVRIYPELVALHFAIKDFLCHFIIYGRQKQFRFYQCIIAYCHQIYNPHFNDEQNDLILSERKLSPETIFNLDATKLSEICSFIKKRFHGHCHVVCGTSILVAITGIYSIHVSVQYGHIMVLCGPVKSLQNEMQIKNLNRRFLPHKIRSHLSTQTDLFEEIRMMNEFWRLYLSITIIVCIVLSCLSLYIITFTDVMFSMKIFFFVIFVQPVAIILLLTLTSASLCFQIFALHKRYYSMLPIRQSGLQTVRIKFKLMSTLELINSKTAGFTMNNEIMIDYKAIGMVMANTTTLFVLVAHNFINNTN